MSILQSALLQRCPKCGRGKLYGGLLKVAPRCAHCGLELARGEVGDGPAFFALTLVGFIVTPAAVIVELKYEPPWWLHALLWPPVIVILSLYFLRFFKALIIAVQYRMTGLK